MSDGNQFGVKIKIKRKTFPTTPIHIRISASPEEKAEGGAMGSSSPTKAEESAFSFPSSPRPKPSKGVKVISGKKGSYR